MALGPCGFESRPRHREEGGALGIGGRIFAALYDRMGQETEAAGLGAHRATLLARASGRVLEIGAGTGRNLAFYGDAVESLVLTEPEEPMARRLERRLGEHPREADVVRASAEALPFADGEFDIAVSTLVLCGVDDQARALGEVRRVLKSGGTLLFIEHVRSEEPGLARRQDRFDRLNRAVARCHCNRSTVDAIRAAGFTITELERDELRKVPSFTKPLVVGAARTNEAA